MIAGYLFKKEIIFSEDETRPLSLPSFGIRARL